jgi:hypothetical protein
MKEQDTAHQKNHKNKIYYQDGRFYFTRQAERTFYFILTMVMLVAGMLYKIGIF